MKINELENLPNGTVLKDEEDIEWLKISDGIVRSTDAIFISWDMIDDNDSNKSLVVIES